MPSAKEKRNRWFQSRDVVGKRIVRVDLNSWRDRNTVHHDPCIVLDDGAEIRFIATETESGDGYGIQPLTNTSARQRKSHYKARRRRLMAARRRVIAAVNSERVDDFLSAIDELIEAAQALVR